MTIRQHTSSSPSPPAEDLEAEVWKDTAAWPILSYLRGWGQGILGGGQGQLWCSVPCFPAYLQLTPKAPGDSQETARPRTPVFAVPMEMRLVEGFRAHQSKRRLHTASRP